MYMFLDMYVFTHVSLVGSIHSSKVKKKKNLKVILSILKIYFSLSNLWYTSTFRNNFEKLIKEDKGNKSFKKVGKARSVER